jgi:predicted F0F1-ATPase subunit
MEVNRSLSGQPAHIIDDLDHFLYNMREKNRKATIEEEGIPVPYRTKKTKDAKGIVNSWYYFGLSGQIGFAIALPIAGGALLGSYIDERFHTYPQYTITLLFAGIVLSMVNFVFTIQSILKRQK